MSLEDFNAEFITTRDTKYHLMDRLGLPTHFSRLHAAEIVWCNYRNPVSKCVVKLFDSCDPDWESYERYIRLYKEAVPHSSLIRLGEIETSSEFPWLVVIEIPFIYGPTLSEWLQSEMRSLDSRRQVMADLMDAVYCLQGSGIVHNGIFANNILIKDNGRPVLLGWSCITKPGERSYRSPADPDMRGVFAPEILAAEGGTTTFESDIYSLGMCFLYILGGVGVPVLSVPDESVSGGAGPERILSELDTLGRLSNLIGPMLRADPDARPWIEKVMGDSVFAGLLREERCPEDDTMVERAILDSEQSTPDDGSV
jgi:serine/threonine protein kinase